MEGGGDGRREGIFWSGRGLGVVWAPPGHDRPEIISFERGSPDKNTHFRAGPFFRIFRPGFRISAKTRAYRTARAVSEPWRAKKHNFCEGRNARLPHGQSGFGSLEGAKAPFLRRPKRAPTARPERFRDPGGR